MPKKLNALLMKELTSKLENVPSGILVDYQGLPSDETYALRKELNSKKIKMQVVKNSIAEIALRNAGATDIKSLMKGPIAVCFSGDDPVTVASVLVEYKKKNKKTKLQIKGGLLDRRVLAPEEVARLAALPSKHQLLGHLAGTLNAPIQGLVMATAGILRKLLYAVKAVQEKKESEGGAAAPAA